MGNKPTNWTSSDVVCYIRKMLEMDAKRRKVVDKKGKRLRVRKFGSFVKVGHGGTLDPLATGVLVIGVGKGTKQLDVYLSGSKRYHVKAKFGTQTDTLDTEGKVIREAP